MFNSKNKLDDSQDHITIANLLSHPIAVLVEGDIVGVDMKQREKTLDSLAEWCQDDNDDINNYKNLFIKHNFEIIEGKSCHTFVKTWPFDFSYITLFDLNNTNSRQQELYDRRRFEDNYLYFKNEKLCTLEEYNLQCQLIPNEYHCLRCCNSTNGIHNYNDNNCTICDKSGKDTKCYYCQKCQAFLCQQCCHSIICVTNSCPNHDFKKRNIKLKYIPTTWNIDLLEPFRRSLEDQTIYQLQLLTVKGMWAIASDLLHRNIMIFSLGFLSLH